MRREVENRLHRVMIKEKNVNIKCPKAPNCKYAASSERCNNFYIKCSLYKKNS
ncbi:MAG: hypothetical protein ACTSR8_21205 [Promethearchaeota archaeon]